MEPVQWPLLSLKNSLWHLVSRRDVRYGRRHPWRYHANVDVDGTYPDLSYADCDGLHFDDSLRIGKSGYHE